MVSSYFSSCFIYSSLLTIQYRQILKSKLMAVQNGEIDGGNKIFTTVVVAIFENKTDMVTEHGTNQILQYCAPSHRLEDKGVLSSYVPFKLCNFIYSTGKIFLKTMNTFLTCDYCVSMKNQTVVHNFIKLTKDD